MKLAELEKIILAFEPGHHGKEWRIRLAKYLYGQLTWFTIQEDVEEEKRELSEHERMFGEMK